MSIWDKESNLFAAVLLAAFSTTSAAVGLLDAYQAARQNDPAFRAARYERDAGLYAIDLGRSGLLPVVAITGSWSTNRGERRYIQGPSLNTTQDLDYRDRSLALTLRQPLFNYDSIVRYRQGFVQAAYSNAVFDKKEAEMAMRLTTAYFEALLAMEKLALSEAEVTAYNEQRQLAERRRQAGEGTITEIAEAESRLQLARAGLADAL
ncbi:MAG TPA: TolC family protein, partial [Accumulibacter sp.]|nr:TolC family protein [Accumulibacter sp.]